MKTMEYRPTTETLLIVTEPDRRGTRRSQRRNSPLRVVPAIRHDLIESDEYEWTTPLNLPGLIVSSDVKVAPPAKAIPPEGRPADQVIETEDGDATSVCQLPGRLTVGPTEGPILFSAPADEIIQCELDEYTEQAAMQMPGRLVEPMPFVEVAPGQATSRGLCASCIHCDSCDFPRPAGGVWRCEEYA